MSEPLGCVFNAEVELSRRAGSGLDEFCERLPSFTLVVEAFRSFIASVGAPGMSPLEENMRVSRRDRPGFFGVTTTLPSALWPDCVEGVVDGARESGASLWVAAGGSGVNLASSLASCEWPEASDHAGEV